MTKKYDHSKDDQDQFDKLHQLYDTCSKEKQAAILWVLENFELIDRITSIYMLPESEIETFLQKKGTKRDDIILRFILLFQKFKQEQSAEEGATD